MQKSIIALFCTASMVISMPTFATALKVKPNAPTRYVVKQGDSLWSISKQYLYRPWQWPALWNVNRSKIRNPHWIYPGQELFLTYVNGRPVLSTRNNHSTYNNKGGIPTIKLQPSIIDMGSGYGIPTINTNFYRLFMKNPQFISDAEIQHAPRIVGGEDSRAIYTKGDRIYADGLTEPGTYLIYRVKQDLKDPVTGQSLGKLVEFNGEVSTLLSNNNALENRDNIEMTPEQRAKLRDNEYYTQVGTKMVPMRSAQALIVNDAVSEIMRGDYLLRKPDVLTSFNIMPHAPEGQIQANIINIMDGISESGMTQTLILNKGEADGLDAGTVLSIYKPSRIVKSDWDNPDTKAAKFVNLPTEEIGLAMIYRTGEHVSSAIILESTTNVNREDILREPGEDLDVSANPTVDKDGIIEKKPGFFDDTDIHWNDVIDTIK